MDKAFGLKIWPYVYGTIPWNSSRSRATWFQIGEETQPVWGFCPPGITKNTNLLRTRTVDFGSSISILFLCYRLKDVRRLIGSMFHKTIKSLYIIYIYTYIYICVCICVYVCVCLYKGRWLRTSIAIVYSIFAWVNYDVFATHTLWTLYVNT